MKTKVLLPLFLLTMFSFIACNNSPIPRVKFDGMEGNVSKVKESTYKASEKFGEAVMGDLEGVTIIEYNDKGQKLVETVYNRYGDIFFNKESVYVNNQLESIITYDKDGGRSVTKFVDRKRNYVKIIYSEGTDQEFYSEQFYDGLYCKIIDDQGELVEEVYYDSKGSGIEDKIYQNGEMIYHILREYDNKHNLSKITKNYRGESEVTSYTYQEFDQKGNWVMAYERTNGKITNLLKREITYR